LRRKHVRKNPQLELYEDGHVETILASAQIGGPAAHEGTGSALIAARRRYADAFVRLAAASSSSDLTFVGFTVIPKKAARLITRIAESNRRANMRISLPKLRGNDDG